MNCKDHKRLRRIDRRVAAIYRKLFPLPTPREILLKLISERTTGAMDFLTYEATLPAVPVGTDVKSQLLDVSVDGTPQLQQPLAAGDATATFEVAQGSSVTLSLSYVDDAGNPGPPRMQTFTAADTIAPDAPGEFGEIRLVSERTVPDV